MQTETQSLRQEIAAFSPEFFECVRDLVSPLPGSGQPTLTKWGRDWLDNMDAYYASAESYIGAHAECLQGLRGHVELIRRDNNLFKDVVWHAWYSRHHRRVQEAVDEVMRANKPSIQWTDPRTNSSHSALSNLVSTTLSFGSGQDGRS